MSESVAAIVVDDEPIVLKTIAKLLALEKYQVTTFSSAEDFCASIDVQTSPYILIVDKNLPGISGLELVDQQKRAGHLFEAILITGYADMNSAIDAVRLGLYSYLRKPFDFEQLLRDVAGAAERLRSRKSAAETDTKLLEQILQPLNSAGVECASVRRALEEQRLPSQADTHLKSTSSILRAIGQLVKDRLVHENLKKNPEEISLQPLYLNETIQEVIRDIRNYTLKENIPLIWLDDHPNVEVIGNPNLLQALFAYLIELALANSSLNETIVVDMEQHLEQVTIHIVVQNSKVLIDETANAEKIQLCQRIAQIQNASLTIAPYLDTIGIDYAVTMPRTPPLDSSSQEFDPYPSSM